MIKTVINTKNYFQAPEDYFWRWAENGEVVEWADGQTICYRDDLLPILKSLSNKRLPSLGSLLIILIAAKEEINVPNPSIFWAVMQRFDDSSLEDLLDDALKFTQIIKKLPGELKTGNQRIHLIQEIFENSVADFSSVQLREGIDEFNSGRLDKLIFGKGEKVTKDHFKGDLQNLCNALQKFPTVESLVLKLKTGLLEVPQPILINPPETPPVGLFDQLAEDPKTIGIARLARRLVAALNIPMHSQGSGDQSYGGITDITNRGNYDKLLLSELAQDSDLLMARLVNNEALYFRREEPPETPKRQRTILVDTTLKMWGIPRVFAISTALALANNVKHGELAEAYALGGESYTEISLDKKEGVIKALEVLDHSLHCGKSLISLIDSMPVSETNEYFFITEENIFNNPSFHSSLSQVKQMLGFILTVNRNGQLQFYECIKGRTKLLSTAKLDLEELLFATGIIPPAKKIDNADISIAFLSSNPAPILFPKSRIKKVENKLFYSDENGLVAINETQRVLYMPKREKGAYELLSFIEKGTYNFGWNNSTELCIAVRNFQRKLFKIYTINLEENTSRYIDLSDKVQFISEIVFNDKKFYIQTHYSSFLFDCLTGEIIETKENSGMFHPLKSHNLNKVDLTKAGEFISGKYSTMYKLKELYISREGKLVFGNYHLGVGFPSTIRIKENLFKEEGSHYSSEVRVNINLLKNKNVKFTIRRWEDGSEAILDSRGLVHLKSSDKSIPEITIVLVTGTNTTCWADDGVISGSSYFLRTESGPGFDATYFYKKYIERFINKIME